MGHSSTSAPKQTAETDNTFSGANAQRKMAAVPVLQKVESEEELPIQGVFMAQRQALEEDLPIQKKPNITGMPDNLKLGIENLSGFSMDDVKVHYNSSKPAQLQALAYAQGSDIHVAPGQEQHLPHEAWHVVQQKQGRVKPTMQMKEGVAVNDDKGLESEADVMGGVANDQARNVTAYAVDTRRLGVQELVVVQRFLNRMQQETLERAQNQLATEKVHYEEVKMRIAKIEQALIINEKKDKLNNFQAKIEDTFTECDNFFKDASELDQTAHSSFRSYEAFVSKVKFYTLSGGKNKLLNLISLAKTLSKALPKKDSEKDSIPSVFLLNQYKSLLGKVRGNVTSLMAQNTKTVSDLSHVNDLLTNLINKVDAFKSEDSNMADSWVEIVGLHQEAQGAITAKKDLDKDAFYEFLSIHMVDKKSPQINSLFGDGSREVGVLNVASRSNKSEGKYMRSQYDHEGNQSSQGTHRNPLGERMKPFLEDDAKDYNIGGSKMITDQIMEQKKLRTRRRSNSSEAFNSLRDNIIEHKNKQVTYIVNGLIGHNENLFVPKMQLDAKYPCVLILFSEGLLKQVESSQSNIPEFITHFLIGHANAALSGAGLRPLIERRQSFGFMTPTMTDVHSGVRLSIGITPSTAWSDAVIQGLITADKNISNIKGYENLGDKQEAKDDHLTMNKFNRGSVLGAGHKLITKLLEENNVLEPSDLNAVFGRKEGDILVKDIETFKPKKEFKNQEVSEEAKELLNRLKSFYEHYIATASGKDVREVIIWETVDPAVEMQKLMDKSLKATYEGGKEVVGLDETSDEEDEEVNRTPSGMSALAVPLVAYREAQTKKDKAVKKGEKSVVYDAAPFSYFEIDGSWKRTFKLDYIERLGVRYPLITPNFKKSALEHYDEAANKKVIEESQPFQSRIEEIKKQGVVDEENIREKFRESIKLLDNEDKRKQGDAVEEEIIKVNDEVRIKVEEEVRKIEEKTKQIEDSFDVKKEFLQEKLVETGQLMDEYMHCKEANLINDNTQTQGELKLVFQKLVKLISMFRDNFEIKDESSFVFQSILSAFERFGFIQMDKAANAKIPANVEVVFVDVNPCMTSEAKFDSGAKLYQDVLQKYQGLRMVVLDTTSSTVKQVNELVSLFQDQEKPAVPFLCLAKSSTKHDQMGLDISTMGRTQYIMNKQYNGNMLIEGEFANLQSASRKLAQNTEPLMVKKMRRDMKKAARVTMI